MVVAWVAFAHAPDAGTRQRLVPVLVTIWGMRLSVYLTIRNLRSGEDYRYQAMRRRWGRWFPLISLGTVFLLQATLMWIVALPVQVAMLGSEGLGAVAYAGIALWTIGLVFESIGDWQLARFKKDPEQRNSVMDRGLWRFSRHPNYFGDFCVWWGIFLVALTGADMLWTAIGPILMSILLTRVSGVALLERSLLTRRPRYAEYVQRTSAFFPLPPRG